MNANTTVGELGIKVDGRNFLLRPSFLAMSRIGTPEEIVLDFRHLCSAFEVLMGRLDVIRVIQPLWAFDCAKHIIECCLVSDDRETDADWLCGEVDYEGATLVREGGKLDADDVVKIAFSMVRYGISGKPEGKMWKKGSSRPMEEFDPSKLVGIAVSQFNMQPDAAWNLTMVEYQRAFEGKFPDDDKGRPEPPTEEEAKACLSWAKQEIERAKKRGK